MLDDFYCFLELTTTFGFCVLGIYFVLLLLFHTLIAKMRNHLLRSISHDDTIPAADGPLYALLHQNTYLFSCIVAFNSFTTFLVIV